MCGLTGYSGQFSPELLASMTKAIAHRGPDGEGVWVNGDKTTGLGHRRLSIIDLSDNAAQPMNGVGNRYHVVFNGEIYNFKKLSQYLDSKGYVYNENSDTAVLAPLYDDLGPDMLKKLNGIFAFAIYDSQKDELFIARDHLGIKPLYYNQNSDGVLFSSEIKSFTHYPKLDKSIDDVAMVSYMTHLWSPGERTMFAGVKKLLPGHFMVVKGGKIKDIKRWYQPPLPRMSPKGPAYQKDLTPADLYKTFENCVQRQLVADVPVGAFLSGGVDSSAIVASMVNVGQKPKKAYCIQPQAKAMKKEGFSDDGKYAKMVAEHLGVDLTLIEADEATLDDMEAVAFQLDEPQADPAAVYVQTISQKAKQDGIKVLMTGTGGDDVFSGYRRHSAIMLKDKLSALPTGAMGAGLKKAARLIPSNTLSRRLDKLGGILGESLNKSLLNAFNFNDLGDVAQLLGKDRVQGWQAQGRGALKQALEESNGHHPLNRMLYMELFGFLPDHNLNYTDKMSMAEGVEVRVPFLDVELLNFAAKLPIHQKYGGGQAKRILKQAFEPYLPKKVLYRSKAGFGAPVRSWMTGEAGQKVLEELTSGNAKMAEYLDKQELLNVYNNTQAQKSDGSYTLLALYMVELWLRKFK